MLLSLILSGGAITGVSAQELPASLPPETTENAVSVSPPPVPDRSLLPTMQQEEMLPPRGTGIPKPPLAWRAGVVKKNSFVSSTFSMPPFAPPIQQRFIPNMTIDAKRVYLSSKDDTFFALLSTCPKKGLMVLFMDSIAGRLVAQVNSATISFNVRAVAGNRSVIEANVERGDKQALAGILDDLLLATGSSMANGGTF